MSYGGGSHYNGGSNHRYNNPRHSAGPSKTVVVPNFSAFTAQANVSRAESSRSDASRSRDSDSSKDRKEDYWRRRSSSSSGGRYPQQTAYYCEVCCINCVGKGSFEAHMVGQQHLKRVKNAASQKKELERPNSDSGGTTRRVENFCEVCNVACSSTEAYNAHLRGQKHQKSMKLYTKLGKPIPESLKPQVVKVIPKTNFTTGGTLNTLTGKLTEESRDPHRYAAPAIAVSSSSESSSRDKPIIGMECIITERNSEGKIINYKCKICDCDMNNSYMRDDHLKGRKHLTEYKLKVNPNLQVNDKKLLDTFKQIEKIRMQAEQEEIRKREYREQGMRNRVGQRERELLAQFPGLAQISSVQSSDDLLLLAKHNDINPPPVEIQFVDRFVTYIETTLKAVSDCLVASQGDDKTPNKGLKGVMRIGPFAKGVMLTGEKQFALVVLSDQKPDEPLIESIHKFLTEKVVEIITDEEFEIDLDIKQAQILVKSKTNIGYQCEIHVTSPAVREDLDPSTDPAKMLNKDMCNFALAEMRHAKWFDSKAKRIQCMSIVVRVLRDLCRRIPTWNNFPCYVMELICDKALRTVAHEMGPAELLRRFFEVLSSGVLLPGEAGVYDPCEKNNQNAAASIKKQDAQDITTSAQHALRLTSLNQLDKILGHAAEQKRKAAAAQAAALAAQAAAQANQAATEAKQAVATEAAHDEAEITQVTAAAESSHAQSIIGEEKINCDPPVIDVSSRDIQSPEDDGQPPIKREKLDV